MGARALFLGFSISSFSLSVEDSASLDIVRVLYQHISLGSAYLRRFVPLCGGGAGLCRVSLLSPSIVLEVVFVLCVLSLEAAATEATALLAVSPCLRIKSSIFTFLNDIGIRLTRISIRVRKPCACKAYCARSFRARSVTVMTIVSTHSV